MSTEKDISPTWILFKSGNSSLVTVNLYSVLQGSTRPIDAYIITECEGEFTKAARRAADIVYRIFEKKFGINPLVAGFDIQAVQAKSFTGSSGGLSFALALAKKLMTGSDPGPVAATGEILGNGDVSPVDGIAEKIYAAIQLLPEESWLFLPAANKNDVSAKLLAEMQIKKIQFRAVASVEDALNTLFQWTEISSPPSEKQTGPAWKKYASLGLILSIILASWVYFQQKRLPPSSKIMQEMVVTGISNSKLADEQQEKIPPYSPPLPSIDASDQAGQNTPRKELRPSSAPAKPAKIHNLQSRSAISISFTSRTELEAQFARLLETALREHLHENGVTGTGVKILGDIVIDKGAPPDMSTAISLRQLTLNTLGQNTAFPDLQLLEPSADNQHILAPETIAKLVDKIYATSNLKNNDSKYWTGIKDFTFAPLEKE